MTKFLKVSHLASVATAALSLAAFQPALAQTGPNEDPQTVSRSGDNRTATDSSDVVVINGITYRDRTDDTAPVLVYDTDYFQRFEPLTAGDALKRVPSVTFLSDVMACACAASIRLTRRS